MELIKRLFLTTSLLIACLFFPNSAFAVLGAGTVWEVRTTGSSNNGGGFDDGVTTPGTDFSLFDAAEDSGTDLACADGDAAPPTVTSATHNFVAADEGNIIQITEAGTGFTLGYYVITDTAGNGAILDRACGADGALANGDWYMGGAALTIDEVVSVAVEENTIWVEIGTYPEYVNASDDDIVTSGAKIILEGYKTSRGDNPTGTDRPYIDAESTRASAFAGGNGWIVKHFRMARSTQDLIVGDNSIYYNCKFSSAGWNGVGSNPPMIGCEITSSMRYGQRLFNCYWHDGAVQGASMNAAYRMDFNSCVGETNTGDAFKIGRGGTLVNCLSFNNTGAGVDGFTTNSGGAAYNSGYIMNCSAVDNGAYGFNRAATTEEYLYFDFNHYNGNGTAGLNNYTAGDNDNTNNPVFTDDTGGDFTLNTASDTALLGTGFMQTAVNGLTGDYQWNIGVDQDKAAGAGTTNDVFGWVD